MDKKIALVLYYHKHNKYSFNALIGALESERIDDKVSIFFYKNKEALIRCLQGIENDYETVIACFSFFTTQLWEIYELLRKLKRRINRKKYIFVAGGPHPSGDPLGTLKMDFDVVVLGEGEETFVELITKILNSQDYANIKGIGTIKTNGEYYYAGKRKSLDLDRYAPFPIKQGKFGPIEITRGCPYQCYFCQTSFLFGSIPRHRSIDSICNYVRIMKEKNLTDIRFITPNAFSYGSQDGLSLNIPKLEELLVKIRQIIGPEGRIFLGSFPSEVRPEHVNDVTLNLIKTHASNDNIIIGAQSGSQKILDVCHRGHDVSDIYDSVDLTIKNGLKVNVDFIFGLPGENNEDVLLTIDLMKKLSRKGARIHAHAFIPLPMTPFASKTARRLDEVLVREIRELTSKGQAFGDWKKQERIAVKISKYLKSTKIR
ncbi:MAG: TIGR04013 family B12-binding domain/radical SAM domain-containing protein [Candidatus Lokiarchaeota archaeon]|nr:TIGR04013 family B12-binding domain/radical SAM domain-containing protein [Candidatus Lokiarchaeota archaeon]